MRGLKLLPCPFCLKPAVDTKIYTNWSSYKYNSDYFEIGVMYMSNFKYGFTASVGCVICSIFKSGRATTIKGAITRAKKAWNKRRG